ncbi:hypothetical protein CFOL_v3_35440, partial [Cephalotus follicularis]
LYELLPGLNCELDQVHVRVLGYRPLPSIDDAFAKNKKEKITDPKMNQMGAFLSKAQFEQLKKLLSQTTSSNPSTTITNSTQGIAFHVDSNVCWMLDSGASDHMTGNLSLFYSYTP